MNTKINLGCGDKHKEGFLNVDIAPECNPDMVVDLEKTLPFLDNTFEHIFSEHTLEHINPNVWDQLLNEIYRIAKPDCVLELILPYDNTRNRTCIDHFRTFSYGSFYINEFIGKDGDRGYFGKLKLKSICKKPNKFYRIAMQIFPYFFNEVYFKFEVVK